MALKTFTKEVNLGTTSGQYSTTGTLKLIVVENSTNVENNTSNVTATLQFIVSQYNWRANSASWSLSGYKSASGSLVSMQYYNGTTTLWTETFDVPHDNSTGNATISFNASFNSSFVFNGSFEKFSCQLTQIPRYTSVTGFNPVKNNNETSLIFNWSTANIVDYVWYSINNGQNWLGVDVADGTSGSFVVNNLSAGQLYNCKIRVRRKDSQLITEYPVAGQNGIQQSTYPYPSISSYSFTIGEPMDITINNPLSRACTISFINNAGEESTSVTTTGTKTNDSHNNSYWTDFWYRAIPNSQRGEYNVRLVVSSLNRNTVEAGSFYYITGGEIPTVSITAVDNDKTLVDGNEPTKTTTYLTGDNKKIIKYISDVNINVTATGQNSSTIASTQISYGNIYMAGSSRTLENAETIEYKGYATDSRGLSNYADITGLTLIDYIRLTLDSVELYRDDQTSNTLKCKGEGDYFNDTFGSKNNSIEFKLRYKEKGSSTWGNWETKQMTIGVDSYSFDFTVGNNFDYTKTYDFQFDIRDKCMKVEYYATAKAGLPILGLFEESIESFGETIIDRTSSGIETSGNIGISGKNRTLGDLSDMFDYGGFKLPSSNVKFGLGALSENEGASNTAVGFYALKNTTTGGGNVAIGSGALENNTTGDGNIAIGTNALENCETFSNNIAIGSGALTSFTSNPYDYHSNIAIGYASLMALQSGDGNTAVGNLTGFSDDDGEYNSYFGNGAGGDGSSNVAVGQNALNGSSGSNNTALGRIAGFNTTYGGCTFLGYNASTTGNNQVQLGGSGTSVYAYSTLNVRSDERDKKDIIDTDLGLEFIKKLRPVKYKWKFRNGEFEGHRYHEGLIAQEVKEVIDELHTDFGGYQDHKINGGDDVLSLGYGEFIAPLIKAIQEQQKIIEELKEKVDNLSK